MATAEHPLTSENREPLPPPGQDALLGPPVGVSPTGSYGPVAVPIAPGTTLLSFTDGLFGRRGERGRMGLERLRQAATADGKGSLEGLLSSVVASGGSGSTDDAVRLGVRWLA